MESLSSAHQLVWQPPLAGQSAFGYRRRDKPETKKPSTLEYTVKPGDSLWEIAEAHLGDGNRYKEIAKLNQTVLKGGVKVMPGMRLKLPTR